MKGTAVFDKNISFQKEKLTLLSVNRYAFSNTSSYAYSEKVKKLHYSEDLSNYQALYSSFDRASAHGSFLSSWSQNNCLDRLLKINYRQFHTDAELSALNPSTLTHAQFQKNYKPLYYHWYGYRVSETQQDNYEAVPLTGNIYPMRQDFLISPHYLIIVDNQYYNNGWNWLETNAKYCSYPTGFFHYYQLIMNNLDTQLYGIKII